MTPASTPAARGRLRAARTLLTATAFLFTLAITGTVAPTTAQSPEGELDPAIGRWQLDVAASKFNPGPPPKAEYRLYEPDHEGIHATITTIAADGRTTTFEYVSSYNDVTTSVMGSTTSDAVKMRRVDAMTAEADLFLGGKLVGHTRRVVSKDGRTMTITLERTAPEVVSNVTVYRRN